jgi:hypothetical protein
MSYESDKEKATGHIPADPDSRDNCPDELFEKYILKLNPNRNRHWQLSKATILEIVCLH